MPPALSCFCIVKCGPSSRDLHNMGRWGLRCASFGQGLSSQILFTHYALQTIFFQSGLDLQIRLNTSQSNSLSLSFNPNCVFQRCCIVGPCSAVRICLSALPAISTSPLRSLHACPASRGPYRTGRFLHNSSFTN